MIAFNGGLDLLLLAVKKEGGVCRAGVIGEDAMRIVVGLVRENRSNQILFAEMGCVKVLALLLVPVIGEVGGVGGEGVGVEAMNALCFILDVVWFVAKGAASSLSSLGPLLPPLLALSLLPPLPLSVRGMALSLVSLLLHGNKPNQQQLLSHPLPPSLTSTPSPLLHLLTSALTSPSPPHLLPLPPHPPLVLSSQQGCTAASHPLLHPYTPHFPPCPRPPPPLRPFLSSPPPSHYCRPCHLLPSEGQR